MNHDTLPQIIAIDGPAASGKTTIGRMLAQRLGYLFLDTGAMYRAVTLAALNAGVDVNDERAVVALAQRLHIEIRPEAGERDGRFYTVWLDGQDVTWDLRTVAVDANVSQVSKYQGVRQEMVRRQRGMAERGQVVIVGRDIGTVVIPDAPLKVYITATPEERARRRFEERQQWGEVVDYQAILADVIRRDTIDSSREHSPMRPAEDAILIDSTGRPPEEILNHIITLIYPSA